MDRELYADFVKWCIKIDSAEFVERKIWKKKDK